MITHKYSVFQIRWFLEVVLDRQTVILVPSEKCTFLLIQFRRKKTNNVDINDESTCGFFLPRSLRMIFTLITSCHSLFGNKNLYLIAQTKEFRYLRKFWIFRCSLQRFRHSFIFFFSEFLLRQPYNGSRGVSLAYLHATTRTSMQRVFPLFPVVAWARTAYERTTRSHHMQPVTFIRV